MARDISGLWTIIQSNGNSAISVTNFHQPDGAFALQAMQLGNGVQGRGGGHVGPESQGGPEVVSFVINWDNSTAGSYHGNFAPDGTIFGATFDMKNPGSTAEWHTKTVFH